MSPSDNLLKTQFKNWLPSSLHPWNLELQQSQDRNCDWPSLFLGKNVHQQIEIFNKTLLNIFQNYIPNKFILCDDKGLPWINEEIKTLIDRKNSLYQRQRKFRSINYTSSNALTLDISNAISSSKLKYHERLANNLNDPKTAPKTYWASWKKL